MPKVKKLSKEERKGEEMFSLWKELTDNESSMRRMKVRNAEIFTKVYDGQGWKDILGSEDSEWVGLLAQIEIYQTRSEVDRAMRMYRRFSLEWGFVLEDLLDVPETRLEKIAKYCKTSSEAQHYLGLARSLQRKDWVDEVNKLQGKPTSDECGHPDGFTRFETCNKCGERHRA